LLQNDTNFFTPHLNNVSIVKPEILIRHVLALSGYRKKLQSWFHLNCVPQIC